MPTAKRLSRSLSVIRPHQQVRRIERGIHATSVVRPDSGFNLHRVQNPLGDLSIGDGSERGENDEFCGLHSLHPSPFYNFIVSSVTADSAADATALAELLRIPGLKTLSVDVRVASAQPIPALASA